MKEKLKDSPGVNFRFLQGRLVLFSSPATRGSFACKSLVVRSKTVRFSDWVPEPPLGFTGRPTVFCFHY